MGLEAVAHDHPTVCISQNKCSVQNRHSGADTNDGLTHRLVKHSTISTGELMNRRKFLATLTASAALLAMPQLKAKAASPAPLIPKGKRPLNIALFKSAIASISTARVAELDAALIPATIPQMQAWFGQGKLTSEELVKYYLWRINKYDLNKLNSVTELNPDALEIAKALDAERAAGKMRGPLHGTVVILKDNIGTGDQLHTTAGARAMQDAKSDRDAFLVRKLREAGVIILGKGALTEWANTMGAQQPHGFSAVGGQVFNPYGRSFTPFGSSTGPAVAVAANFATFSIGTETWGSLTAAAIANSVVTLKPSIGLVSRDRVIPLLDFQDTAGPLTRNVTDMALVMNALVGSDANDPVTAAAADRKGRFDDGLGVGALKEMRVGVLPAPDPINAPFQQHLLEMLKAASAVMVMLPQQPDTFANYGGPVTDPLFAYYQKFGTELYLSQTNAPFKTLKAITEFNLQDKKDRMAYGQEYLQMAADSTLSAQDYAAQKQAVMSKARNHIDGLMATHKLDLIIGTHLAVLDNLYYPGPGYPAIALQAGYRESGEPVGYIMTGRLFDDWKLVRAGYALEQATQAWRPPDLKHWK